MIARCNCHRCYRRIANCCHRLTYWEQLCYSVASCAFSWRPSWLGGCLSQMIHLRYAHALTIVAVQRRFGLSLVSGAWKRFYPWRSSANARSECTQLALWTVPLSLAWSGPRCSRSTRSKTWRVTQSRRSIWASDRSLSSKNRLPFLPRARLDFHLSRFCHHRWSGHQSTLDWYSWSARKSPKRKSRSRRLAEWHRLWTCGRIYWHGSGHCSNSSKLRSERAGFGPVRLGTGSRTHLSHRLAQRQSLQSVLRSMDHCHSFVRAG